MIKKIKTYIVLAAVALSVSSCLDKYPENAIPSDQAIQTVNDVDQAVIGIYDAFKSSALYSGNLTLLPDIQTDLVYGVNGNTGVYGSIWRWNDILSNDKDIESVYAALYEVIGRCNFLFDNLEKVRAKVTEEDDLDKLDQCAGEAHFARALAYAELIKLFCKPYESDEEAANELGVVISRHSRGDEPMVRASLKDSYQFVLDELDLAAEGLALDEDEEPSSTTLFDSPYFNEYTVYALRARVALYMKKWDEAVKYSTKVIDSGYYQLSSCNEQISQGVSYYKYMWTNDQSTETIWKIAFTATSYGGALGKVFFNYDYSTVRPDYVPASWVLGLYDAYDLRYEVFFQDMATGYSHQLSWPLLIKYFGNQQFTELYGILHVSMPKVFRLSEQYLIRAEAYCNLNKFGEAGKDLTKLRSARMSSSGNIVVNKDKWLDAISDERVRELYMEGFRLQDLKRWHRGFERKPQSQSLTVGSSLKVEKDDKMFVWPIPLHELEAPGSQILPNESNKY